MEHSKQCLGNLGAPSSNAQPSRQNDSMLKPSAVLLQASSAGGPEGHIQRGSSSHEVLGIEIKA